MSVEYNRKSAQPQQVRQVAVDLFSESDPPEHQRRPKDDPFTSPSHEEDRPPDLDDLFRRISSLVQTVQGRVIVLCTTKGLSEAEVKGKVLDDFAQLSNGIWDALYRHRSRTEVTPQPREWMRKLLKLEDEKRAVEAQARVAIEEATTALQERLEACEVEISHLRETNAFLEQQHAVRLKPKAEVKVTRPGIRRLERELNESIPKALAIARDLSLDSSVSSGEHKHSRHNSTSKEAKIAPMSRKDPKDRSVSPSDRQIHLLKTELERSKSQLQKYKQDKERLQAWKDSYLRSPPQLTSALQQLEQDNEHEHKKLVGKTLILQHKLNAIQLGAQRFIRISSALLRFARDREAIAQFEDARSELDVLLREIQRESKPGSISMGATPSSGSPSRFSSAIHTPEKRPEPDRAFRSLEKENRKLEEQLQTERKRADTFAEALEVTQREVEALHGVSISPVLFIQQQEHTIRTLQAQVKAESTESEANKRNTEVGDQLRRALDQVQVLRTSNNALMQDLVDVKGDVASAKDVFKAEIARICGEMDKTDSIIKGEFAKKDGAITRLKHSVFNRLRGYEATLVRLNSLFPSPTKELDLEEKQHLEYLLQRSEDLRAAKETELQAVIDQQEAVVAALRREVQECKETVGPLQEKVKELESERAQAREADSQRLRGELNSCTAQLRQKEAVCHQLLYEKHQQDATYAALMEESRTKSEDLLKAEMDFQCAINEANKRIEDLAQTLQSTQEELQATKASEQRSAAVLTQKKEKLRVSRTQGSEQSTKLAQELLSLQAELDTCKGQLQLKELEVVAQSTKIGEQEKSLDTANQRIGALTKALECHQEEADKERIAAGRLTSELSAMRVTVEDYSRKAELLSVDKAALKEALESLKAKHEISSREREGHIQEVLSSLIHNQTRIKELEEDIALVLQERDTACQQLDTALLQLTDLQQSQALLTNEVEEGKETEKKLRDVQNQVTALQRTKAGLESSNERLTGEIQRLTGEIQRLTGENKSQRERLDQLTLELAAAQKDKSLGALVTQLQREAEESRQELEETRQIKQAKELAYSRALEESKRELEACSKLLHNTQNELKTCQNALLETQESRKSTEIRLGKEIIQLQNETKSLKSTIQSEKEALEHTLNRLQAAKEAEISTLNEQLNRSKAGMTALQGEKQRLETDMEKISLALKDISAALEATEKETDQIKTQRSQLTTELAQFQLDNSRLSSLVGELRKEIESTRQEKEAELEKSGKEREVMRKQVGEAEEVTRALQVQIAALQTERSRLSGEVAEGDRKERERGLQQEAYEENRKELEGIITLLQAGKQHLERANEELKTQSDHLSEELSTYLAQLSTLQSIEKDRDSLLKQLAETKLAARQDREQLQLRIEHMERDAKAGKETIAQCREEMNATERLLVAANETMEQERRTEMELRREKEGLLGQVRSLTDRLEAAYQQLERESKEQGDQSTRLRQDLRETLQKLADTHLLLEARDRDIARVQTTAAQLQSTLDQVRNEKHQLTAHLSELITARDTLQQSLDEKEAELLVQATALQSASVRLQDLEADLSLKLAQFKATLQDTQSKLATAQTSLELYRKKAETLEEECSHLRSSDKQGKEAAAEVQKVRAELMNALQMLGVTRRETAETIESLQHALKTANSDKERLLVRNERLETDLRNCQTSSETLEKELETLKDTLQREKAQAVNRFKSLQDDFSQQSASLTAVQRDLEGEKTKLREASEAWKRETASQSSLELQLNASIAALQREVQAKAGESSRLELEVQKSAGEVGELKAALETSSSLFKRSCKEIEDLKGALTTTETKVSNLEKELRSALQTIGINRRDQAESTEKLQATIKTLREKGEELERTGGKLRAEKEELVRNAEELRREREDLKGSLVGVKERVGELEQVLGQRDRSLSVLQRENEGLEAQAKSLSGRLEEAYLQLERESKAQGDQSSRLRQDLRETQQKLADTHLLLEARDRDIAQIQQSHRKLEDTIATEVHNREKLTEKIVGLEKTIGELQNSVHEKDQEVEMKVKQIAKLDQDLVQLRSNMSEELSGLQIAQEMLSKQNSALADRLKVAEQDLSTEQSRSRALGKDLEEGESRRTQVEKQLQEEKIHMDTVTKQLQAAFHSIEQFEFIKAKLETQMEQLLASSETSQTVLTRENAVLTEELRSIEKLLRAEQDKSSSLTTGLNTSECERKRLVVELQDKEREAETRVQQLNSELDTLRTEAQQLQAAIRLNEQLELTKAKLETQMEQLLASSETSQTVLTRENAALTEELRSIEKLLRAEQVKSSSLATGLNTSECERKRLVGELQDKAREAETLRTELAATLTSKDLLEHRQTLLETTAKDQTILLNALSQQLQDLQQQLQTAKFTLDTEKTRTLQLEETLNTLNNELAQLKEAKNSLETQLTGENTDLEQRFKAVSLELATAKAHGTEVNELNHYLEAESAKLEKQLAELTEAKEALEKANSEQETEIARLIEEVRKANSGETGDEPMLGSLRSENNLGNLSGVSPFEEEKLSSADSLDLGAAYNSLPRQDTEPMETDPPIRVEEGEISPDQLIIDDLKTLLEPYRSPQDDLAATVQKLLEEFELMKKNPARNVIPRLNLRSQKESKETQTSPRDDLSQVEELKGSSNADSVELDKSIGGGSEAADQDTPRQKILPELWMKPIAHKIHQAKGNEATALRSKVKALEQELQEEKTIAEHLNGQNRLLKEEVAEKDRHIKRLEVAETAGEKSPVNIEHLKDVLVKLIMQLPKQAANAETLINTIFSVLFLTPQDIQHIDDARKGIKKKLFGLFK